jgi:hypothetical protein
LHLKTPQNREQRLEVQQLADYTPRMKLTARLLCLCCVAVLLSGCSGTYEPRNAKGQAECYRMEFGTLPPAGVTNIQAKQIIIGDAARAWLRFEATPALVDSLLKGFTSTNRQSFDAHSGGANTPTWWTPDSNHITTFYVISGWRKDFSHSSAVLAHDADKHTVYFCHDAFD